MTVKGHVISISLSRISSCNAAPCVYLSSHDAVASIEVGCIHVHRAALAFGHAPFTT